MENFFKVWVVCILIAVPLLRPVWRDSRRFAVYLFGGAATYCAWCAICVHSTKHGGSGSDAAVIAQIMVGPPLWFIGGLIASALGARFVPPGAVVSLVIAGAFANIAAIYFCIYLMFLT